MQQRQYYVYIMMNTSNTAMYIGVTNDLQRRVYEHVHHCVEGFTRRYKLHKLVYFETGDSIEQAIVREKQLKNWHRDWKMDLIISQNPDFDDLAQELFQIPNQVRNDEIRSKVEG